MGTWGYGSFENDDALDWLIELEDSDDLSLIKDTVEEAIQPGTYIDAYLACKTLAAAEIIAALLGRPSDDFPPEAAVWAGRSIPVPNEMILRALSAVDSVANNSELKDLWDEAELTEDWLSVVENLKFRLLYDVSNNDHVA